MKQSTEPKRFLSRDAILSADDTTYEDVYVEEWDGWVRVRSLTAGERDRWERLVQGLDNEEKSNGRKQSVQLRGQHSRAYAVQMATVDQDGQRLFPRLEDVLVLSRKNSAAVTRIFAEIIKLSKVTKEDLKEMEGEYDTDPTVQPSTDSPTASESGT